jgi:integrase
MATVKKQGNGYKITVSCGYDASGKQIRRHMTWTPDPGMTAKQEAKELDRQKVLFEEKAKSGDYAVGNVKFENLAREWLVYVEKKSLMRVRTLDRMKQLQERTYAAIGHLRMDRIATAHIQAFIDNLAEPGVNKQTGGGLSPKTQKHYLTFISDVFEFAIKRNMLHENPCRHVDVEGGKSKGPECYSLEEAQQFLVALESAPIKYRTFFTLAIYGGFRRAELLGLEWKDIDFASGVITISRTSLYTKEKGMFTDTTKTKSSQRSLKLPDEVITLLRAYKSWQASERLKIGDQWIPSDRLFTAWNGAPMGHTTAINWLRKFCERNNLRYVNIHSFRHLNATLLINSGTDVRTVSAALGHSQASTTLNIYAHAFAQAQAKASEAIAASLDLGKKKA